MNIKQAEEELRLAKHRMKHSYSYHRINDSADLARAQENYNKAIAQEHPAP